MGEWSTRKSIRLAETKLMVPTSSGWSFERTRLVDLLEAAAPTRLILLVAPAGYGKTMLAEAWLRRQDENSTIGWLSLDTRDDDPVRFWMYLVECVARLGATVDDRLLEEVRADPGAAAELCVELVNALARLEARSIVVIDDLHVVQREEVLGPLLWLIDAAPSTTTFMVMSRASAPWPVARLQARGETIVLDDTDLAFEPHESAAVLAAMAPAVNLTQAQSRALHDRTEGWPVAVQLAAQSLRRHRDHERLLEDASAIDRAVDLYFLEEVLAGLEPEMHRFLLDISVCEPFSAELASSIAGENVAPLVSEVLDEHLFVVALDADGEWYRLHHVIRSLLLDELTSQDPGRVRMLNRRAATWHLDNGDTSSVINHLLAAEAFEEAFDRIVEATNDYWVAGRAETLLTWMRALPVEHLERRAAAAARLSLNLTMLARYHEARNQLDTADRARDSVADRRAALTARSVLEFLSGHVSAALQAVAKLEELIDSSSEQVLDPLAQPVNLLMVKAVCYELLGEEDQRRQVLDEFNRRRHELTGFFALSVDGVIARLEAEDGSLETASAHARRALDQAGDDWVDFPTMAYPHFALARVAWCEGRLDDAEIALADMARINHGHSIPSRVLRAVGAAEIYASNGRFERVDDMLRDAWDGEPSTPTPMESRALIAGWGVWICAVHDRDEEARAWLSELDRVVPEVALSSVLSSRCSLVARRPDEVVCMFGHDGAGLPVEPLPRLRSGLVLHAALSATGQDLAAHDLLGPLLSHAERHGLVQPIVDDRRVLALVTPEGEGAPSRSFCELVHRAGSTKRAVPHVAELVDQISPREFDVIPLLPTRMTNSEIAAALYVSLNTLKTHLRSVYRKLGVSTRDEAIQRCRELGLL